MRWFLRRKVPSEGRVLLVESGPRIVAEQAIPRLRQFLKREVPIDVLTCQGEEPAALASDGAACRVWRVSECRNRAQRWRMLKEIRKERHAITAIVCANSPIMAPWRAASLVMFPSKFLIVNEHADFFWLDRGHWRNLVNFALVRGGWLDDTAVRTFARLIVFPFTLAYLVAYAASVHLRRLLRWVFRLRPRRPAASGPPASGG